MTEILRDRLPIELAELSEPPLQGACSLEHATVVEAGAAGVCTLEGATDRFAARRALSCLVVPHTGDLVLASRAGDRAFVLSVLDRKGLSEAELALPDPAARLTLRAAELDISASTQLRLSAPDAAIEAGKLGLFGQSLSLAGKLLTVLADRLRISAAHQDTAADQIATRARQRVTVIEGTDSEHIGILSQTIESTAAITADTAIVATRKDLRLDGERISVG